MSEKASIARDLASKLDLPHEFRQTRGLNANTSRHR